MTYRTAAAALLLAALPFVSLDVSARQARARLMPVAEVKPGMVGVGRTVFEGSELSEFTVHIIGVLRNIQGPKRDLILARLEGRADPQDIEKWLNAVSGGPNPAK